MQRLDAWWSRSFIAKTFLNWVDVSFAGWRWMHGHTGCRCPALLPLIYFSTWSITRSISGWSVLSLNCFCYKTHNNTQLLLRVYSEKIMFNRQTKQNSYWVLKCCMYLLYCFSSTSSKTRWWFSAVCKATRKWHVGVIRQGIRLNKKNKTRNAWQSLAYSPLGATVSPPSRY